MLLFYIESSVPFIYPYSNCVYGRVMHSPNDVFFLQSEYGGMNNINLYAAAHKTAAPVSGNIDRAYQ